MILILIIIAVLALGAAAAALVLRTGVPGVPAPVTTQSFEPLHRAGVQADDLIELQFDQAVRGYRMSQVDNVLDRLAEELRDRDSEIAELRAELAAVPVDFTPETTAMSPTSTMSATSTMTPTSTPSPTSMTPTSMTPEGPDDGDF